MLDFCNARQYTSHCESVNIQFLFPADGDSSATLSAKIQDLEHNLDEGDFELRKISS